MCWRIKLDIRDSRPDWEPYEQPKAPEGFPGSNGHIPFGTATIAKVLGDEALRAKLGMPDEGGYSIAPGNLFDSVFVEVEHRLRELNPPNRPRAAVGDQSPPARDQRELTR